MCKRRTRSRGPSWAASIGTRSYRRCSRRGFRQSWRMRPPASKFPWSNPVQGSMFKSSRHGDKERGRGSSRHSPKRIPRHTRRRSGRVHRRGSRFRGRSGRQIDPRDTRQGNEVSRQGNERYPSERKVLTGPRLRRETHPQTRTRLRTLATMPTLPTGQEVSVKTSAKTSAVTRAVDDRESAPFTMYRSTLDFSKETHRRLEGVRGRGRDRGFEQRPSWRTRRGRSRRTRASEWRPSWCMWSVEEGRERGEGGKVE